MYRYYFSFILFLIPFYNSISQTYQGTINNDNKTVDSVTILVFDYSTHVQTYYSDLKGAFSISIPKNQEYIICFVKFGFKSISNSICIQSDVIDNIQFTKDVLPPSAGLVYEITSRYSYDTNTKKHVKKTIDISTYAPLQKADSIKVIFNKAQSYLYAYISSIQFKNELDALQKLDFSEQTKMRNQIMSTLTSIEVQKKQCSAMIMYYAKEEQASVSLAKTKVGRAQVKCLVDAQENLYKRIFEEGKNILRSKDEALLFYKLKMLDYFITKSSADLMQNNSDILAKKRIQLNTLSSAYNYLYLAEVAYQNYDKQLSTYQKHYQEYIELLKYYKGIKDSAYENEVVLRELKKEQIELPLLNNTPRIALLDSVLKLNNAERELLLYEATREEERFASWKESDSEKILDGEKIQVHSIYLEDDVYDTWVTKKGEVKYMKNNKPISALTYKLETNRKYKGIIPNATK